MGLMGKFYGGVILVYALDYGFKWGDIMKL